MNEEKDDGKRFRDVIEKVARTYFSAHKRPIGEVEDFLFSLDMDSMDKEQLMAVLFLTAQVKVEIL